VEEHFCQLPERPTFNTEWSFGIRHWEVGVRKADRPLTIHEKAVYQALWAEATPSSMAAADGLAAH
jgi:hypothetical protein